MTARRRRRDPSRPPEDWDLLGGLPDEHVPASPPAKRSGEPRPLAPWPPPPQPEVASVPAEAQTAPEAEPVAPPDEQAAPAVGPAPPVEPAAPPVRPAAPPVGLALPAAETVVLPREPVGSPRRQRTGLLVAAATVTAAAVVAGALLLGGGDDTTELVSSPATSEPTPAAEPSTQPAAAPTTAPAPTLQAPATRRPPAGRTTARPTTPRASSAPATTAPRAPTTTRPPERSFVPRSTASIRFPGDLLGSFRDAAASRAARQAAGSGLRGAFDDLQVGVYGRRTDTFTVYAGGAVDTRPGTGLARFRVAYDAGSPTDLGRGTAVDPGDRGGVARCWLTSLRGVRLGVCGFFDARSAVVLVDATETRSLRALASRGRTVREAVVR